MAGDEIGLVEPRFVIINSPLRSSNNDVSWQRETNRKEIIFSIFFLKDNNSKGLNKLIIHKMKIN